MKKISEGAEAKIFTTEIAGKSVIVKVREPKKYRISEIDVKLRRGRTRSEAKVMHRARNAGANVPRLIAVSEFTIVSERAYGVMLKDISCSVWLARQIGSQLAKMHDANIVHGDFTPANIMVFKGKPIVIDFGLAEVSMSIEEKALDVLLMKRGIGKPAYAAFVKGYSASKAHSEVLKRLSKIERRGRYQTRTLA